MMNPNTKQTAESALDRLVEQICDRIHAGEMVQLDNLIAQYPEMADRLRDIYPTLTAMANWNQLDSEDAPISGDGVDQNLNQTIGDFQIVRQLGRGGMGIVYEAQQLTIRRRVALKILPLAALVDSRALQRFRNEVSAIATLEHPHIVSVYSVGEERGIHYFAMQLIRGQSLAAVIGELQKRAGGEGSVTGDMLGQVVSDMELSGKTGSGLLDAQHQQSRSDNSKTASFSKGDQPREPELDETLAETVARGRSVTNSAKINDQTYFRNIVRLIQQAADGLQHAHDHGIVHRDVKPGNLLLDTHGSLFVTDFGLARIETGAGVTMTGDVLGTLRYMSPEQILANRVVIDHRTDVYSLGATLYELLTLQPIWPGDGKAELIRQISFEEPTRPRRVNPAIPIDLETVVLKAISKNPTGRYESAQAMADDLGRYLDRKPIRAHRTTVSEHLTKWVLRHRALVALALAACFVITVTSCVAAILIWNESQRRISAEAAKQVAVAEADSANKRTGVINSFVIANIVDSANPMKGGSRDITVRDSILKTIEKVEGTFSDDPVLGADVNKNLGNYMYWIGEYAVARRSLEEALAVYEKEYGKENSDTLNTLVDLAKVYRELNELNLAAETNNAVIESTLKLNGTLDHRALGSMFELAAVHSRQKQFAKAEQTAREVIKLARAGEFPVFEALGINVLGEVSYGQQQYNEAELHWTKALEMFEKLDDADNSILVKGNLAKVYWETDRQEASIAMLEKVLKQRTERGGETHPDTLRAILLLATRKMYSGDAKGGTGDFRLLLDRKRSKYGPRHEKTAEAMTNLGTALLKSGEFDEALALQKTAIEIYKECLGENHPNVLYSLGSMARTCGELGDIETARECYQSAIDGRMAIAGEHPENWQNAVGLGGLYCNFGNFLRDEVEDLDESVDRLSKAIETLEQINLSSPTDVGKRFLANSYISRAETLGMMEHWDKATEDADDAVSNATSPGQRDEMLLEKARLTARLGDQSAALATVEDVLTRVDARPDADYQYFLAARVMALCEGDSQKTIDANDSDPQVGAGDFAARSIQLLEKAQQAGYFGNRNKVNELHGEEDFKSIRNWAEFKSFCQQLAASDEKNRP